MIIEQPTFLLRHIYPKGVFRMDPSDHSVYLTFDDGPIPEVTPWLLDVLDRYQVKATFFVVGDNVRKYPEIFQMILDHGHIVGNHTFNHVRGMQMRTPDYIDNVEKCQHLFKSNLFRPPHGVLRRSMYHCLETDYKIIFYDVVTRDYSKRQTGPQVLENVKRYARNGSVIVFHDSLRSKENLQYALPKAIEWLREKGYQFKTL